MEKFGIPMDEAQIWKNLNKARVRRKTHKQQIRNKKIELKEWKGQLYKYMEGETNPYIWRVKGGFNLLKYSSN